MRDPLSYPTGRSPDPSSSGGPGGAIGLWVVDLDRWSLDGHDDDGLTDEDRRQAARLRDGQQGARLLSRRSATRCVLASVLGEAASQITIARRCPTCGSDQHGRPYLPGSPVVFSVSSCSHRAAVAVAEAEVGVDVELERPDTDPLMVALTERERRQLEAIPSERRGPAFLRLWTTKEAVLKGGGRGLGDDPATIDACAVLVGNSGTVSDGDRRWHVHQLRIDGSFAEPLVVAVADLDGRPIVRRTIGE